MYHPYSEKRIVRCKDTGEEVTGNLYLSSKHWKMMREKVYEDRNGECEKCHAPLTLDKSVIHHNSYKRLGNEKLADLNLLCDKCHKAIHKAKREGHAENKDVMTLYTKLTKSERKLAITYMEQLIESRR